jgi:rSAM/selenodomain-associated transferase 1
VKQRRPAQPTKVRAPHRRAAPFRLHLVVMAKMPMAGRVKTRLARDVGTAAATRFVRTATASLLHRIGRNVPWKITLSITLRSDVAARIWPRGFARADQGGGDLGARMQRIMLQRAPGPVVIMGTDVPDIAPDHIHQAFRLLGRHDAVLGPAADGGYWLVGLRRRPRILRPFGGVRWSGPHALSDTLAGLSGASVGFLETLSDVDSGADLARCRNPGRVVRKNVFTAKTWRDNAKIVL